MRDSLNEILLNRMRQKNHISPEKKGTFGKKRGKRNISNGKPLPPDKQRRMMHYNNKKLFRMIEKNEEEEGKLTD